MAGHVLKRRRLVNRGRRRLLSAKQIKYFGTPRQKEALRRSRARKRSTSRHRNIGHILTVIPANPARRRRTSVAVHHRRRNRRHATSLLNRRHHRRHNRHHNARRHSYTLPALNRRRNRRHSAHHRRRHHLMNPRVVYRYRNRAHSRRHHNRHYNRHRNPAFLKGELGAVVGVLGGAAVTSILTGFLPSTLTTGPVGYISTGVVAVVQGQVLGRLASPQFGQWMTVGGLVILALKMINDFFPQLQLPLALTGNSTGGIGLITSSNFYVPQVNVPGSMATFVTPAGVTAALPIAAPAASGMHGMGQYGLRTIRRVGRMR